MKGFDFLALDTFWKFLLCMNNFGTKCDRQDFDGSIMRLKIPMAIILLQLKSRQILS